MKAKCFMTHSLRLLLPVLLFLLPVPLSSLAADNMESLLPPTSCGPGWKIDGKPIFYDRDTLSDRINGEAELYFPYGFDRMAAARYAAEKNTAAGMDVEIYRMGSPLDAFGMYANYRQKDGRILNNIGTESNLSGSQIFFYQGRHFVHIQVTGNVTAPTNDLQECAQAVVSRLPGDRKKPIELVLLDRPDMVKETARYLPQNLLGYDFLNRGIITDAVVEGTNLQIFVLLGTTAESASTAFDRYRSQLTGGKIESGGSNAAFLEGVDPLYGPVVILKRGNCLTGALKFIGKKGIHALLESVCRQ